MILVLGEVLIDRFPDYRRIGGAPLNFAFHLHHLGADVRMVTRVGDDDDGRRIREMIAANGLTATDVQRDNDVPTGVVEITLDADGVPVFDIVSPAAYDFIDLQLPAVKNLVAQAELIYFGSLVMRSERSFAAFRRGMEDRHTAARCFCDINLRPPHYDRQRIAYCLRQADILKLNDEELTTIGAVLDLGADPATIAERLMADFRIQTLAVTRGAHGSTVYQAGRRLDAPPPPAVAVRDTVGAGDAFAAVLAFGVLHNHPMRPVLSAATEFAAHVCGQNGALPAQTDIYPQVLRQIGDTPP
jgi:fructokinase